MTGRLPRCLYVAETDGFAIVTDGELEVDGEIARYDGLYGHETDIKVFFVAMGSTWRAFAEAVGFVEIREGGGADADHGTVGSGEIRRAAPADR